ncbi:MAG: aspartate aminotransferase family protein [Acidiferrobacteraceae bacterium]|nr:aspartate aminotransferase family protein [Acidiferrobacteraceae bacterium]|tara:strand:+ start:957 stop:2336 length:1380 start_codon:yes stop_codon:yes gene_type:complete
MTQTEKILAMDSRVIHPWEGFGKSVNQRTIISHGDGIYVYDNDGNKLLDGPGGMWCNNVGHGQKRIVDAMTKQAAVLSYVSPWSHPTEVSAQLATKLAEMAPGDLNRVHYTTGGSTAVDSALRFVMFYNNVRGQYDKKHILSRHDAYHGSTYLSASVSGKSRDKNWLDFESELVHFLTSPNPYRMPKNMDEKDFVNHLLRELEETILDIGPNKVAAFIAEPILASGGVIVPPAGYHMGCLQICRQYDVLYISDEVVTGFGRLGHWFASEEVFGIVPDIITTAKGITSSYAPLGAVLISDRLINEVDSLSTNTSIFANGFTYSGHPVACAAALANIEIIQEENLLENARNVGCYMQEKLKSLIDLPIVGDIRGLGLMGCVECVASKDTREPLEADYKIGARIDAHCQSLGLLVRPLINMCVLSPALLISESEVDDMIAILRLGIERATADLCAKQLTPSK